MQLFASKSLLSFSRQKYIFPDNDFLNCLFKNEDFFQAFCCQSGVGTLLYDPLIEFEFLRDMFVPLEAIKREEFINLDSFLRVETQANFMKLQNNALLTSKIIGMNKSQNRAKKSAPSFTDLYLIARIMMSNPSESLLITGNKKDFPNYLFDTEEIIIAHDENNQEDILLKFYALRFNKEKFNKEYGRLKKLYKNLDYSPENPYSS